jgi:hypothetical protein
MITAILLLALMQPQAPGLAPATDTSNVPDRTEKLTPAEAKSLADANQAKAALQGATEGVELAHHANTDCGCYVESTGRDYDKVEFKGDTIFIHHIHEAPGSLTKKP